MKLRPIFFQKYFIHLGRTSPLRGVCSYESSPREVRLECERKSWASQNQNELDALFGKLLPPRSDFSLHAVYIHTPPVLPWRMRLREMVSRNRDTPRVTAIYNYKGHRPEQAVEQFIGKILTQPHVSQQLGIESMDHFVDRTQENNKFLQQQHEAREKRSGRQ